MHNCSYLHADHAHRARAPPTPQPVAKLLLYAGLRLCALIPASLCLRVPTGAFLPCFVTGAALGRALGQLLDAAALLHGVEVGCLAVCGAAALTAAVTRTTSTGVVALELTGQLSLQLPLLVATTSAFLASSALGSPSVFDVMRDHSVWQQQEERYTAAPPTHLAEPLLPGGQHAEANGAGASPSRDSWWARLVSRRGDE